VSARHFATATETAGAVSRREASSRELTEWLLSRIEAVDPGLNAVVELRPEAALAEATAADEAVFRRVAVGPLHGVPLTVKEAFNVEGLHTTWGNPEWKDFVADWDATVVGRLRAAGAIVVGKTNAHQLLGDFAQTANQVYGVTNNPWDTSRTPGGSSGGAAAAVAAGLTFLDYGSDLVGSIRIPATSCGVYGLRPSAGTVPLTGLQPPGPPAAASDMTYLSTVGPLARSAGDLRTALQATGGPEAPASAAYSWTLPPPRHARLRDFRVGVVLDDPSAPVSSELAPVLSEAIDAVGRAGASVVAGWPERIEPAASYESFGFHLGLFFAHIESGGDATPLSAVVEHERRRTAYRAAWDRYFEAIDVFVCPVNFTPAIPHDTRPFDARTVTTPGGERPYHSQPVWTAHAALAGLPAVSAPIGRTSGGLPVGLQILGPRYEDNTAITFAELLTESVGGYQPPAARSMRT